MTKIISHQGGVQSKRIKIVSYKITQIKTVRDKEAPGNRIKVIFGEMPEGVK